MRYLVASTVLLLCFSVLSAKTSPEPVLNKANDYFISGNFDKAAELYQALVDSGYVNAELYFNLGNSYFKLNRIPYAILNYERAYKLKPNDEDIEFNLEYAKTLIVDRIEPLPEFILSKWYRATRSLLTSNGWAWVSLIGIGSILSLMLLFWFAYQPWVKRVSFIFAILLLLITIQTSIFSAQEKRIAQLRNEAIIFQSVVTVKSSPGDSGKELFILHSGTKVTITKAFGQWVEIRIADGNKGWIPSETIELI